MSHEHKWVNRGPIGVLDDMNVADNEVWTSVDGQRWYRNEEGDCFQEVKLNPRENADDAYYIFMHMSDDQWTEMIRSLLLEGGVLTLPEQAGFRRAYDERRAL